VQLRMQLESSLVRHAREIEWWGDALDAVEQAIEDMKRKHAKAMCGLEQTHAGAVVALKAEAVEEGRKAAARGRGKEDARFAAAAAAHALELRSMEEGHVAALKDLRQRLPSLQHRAATPAARGEAERISSSAGAPSSRLRQRGAGGAASPPTDAPPAANAPHQSLVPHMRKYRPEIQVNPWSNHRFGVQGPGSGKGEWAGFGESCTRTDEQTCTGPCFSLALAGPLSLHPLHIYMARFTLNTYLHNS